VTLLSVTRGTLLINLRKYENRARVHFIPNLKVGVFVTLRTPFVIISDYIANATSEPLLYLLPHVNELREINEYASQFYHDTNPSADSVNVVDAELLPFARRSLGIIYKG